MKKKCKFVNGKFVERKFEIKVNHVLLTLTIIVISALIYLNV